MRALTTIAAAILACGYAGEMRAQVPSTGNWVVRGDHVVLIYDSSNSMKALTDAPETQRVRKQAIAQASAKRMLDRLLASRVPRNIAVIAFGHQYGIVNMWRAPVERQRVCDLDVQTLVPSTGLTGASAAAATEKLNRLQPKGMTPISQSLAAADAALGPGGGAILLITDWEDPCGRNDPPPCAELVRLNAQRVGANHKAVHLSVILVPRSPNMNTSYVKGLSDCSGAQLVYLTRMSEIAPKIDAAIPVYAPELAQPATIRLIQLMPLGVPGLPELEILIVNATDTEVARVNLTDNREEVLQVPSASYRARIRFPDGRNAELPLGMLEPGAEKELYVTRQQ